MNVIRCALLLLALTGVSATAQTALLDNFNSGTATGAVKTGTSWVNNVTQNPTSITVGPNANNDNGWEKTGLTLNGASMTHITVVARRDSGNVAPSLVVQLIDANLKTVIASVAINDTTFPEGSFATVNMALATADVQSGFDFTRIARWSIGGGTPPLGQARFRMTFDNLSLTGGLAPTPPTITVEPLDRAIGVSTGTTMTVAANANNSGPLTYQWKKGGSIISGATLATLSIADAPLTASGLYQVTVSNDAGPTLSRQATLTVLDARPTHILGPGFTGYIAGETLTISNTITHGGGASGLRWSVTLPEASGWTFVSDTATTAANRPSIGTQSLIEWVWTTVPSSPYTFTYTLNIPSDFNIDTNLAALVQFTHSGISGLITAKPDPLIVRNALSRHSADSNGDLAISLSELTRVIELYNTQNGSVRTGAYDRASVVTEDGFIAAPTRPDTATTLTRYHSADYIRDGRIDLVELLRVIELYNARAGTLRTGRYHADPSSVEDGFAPGP